MSVNYVKFSRKGRTSYIKLFELKTHEVRREKYGLDKKYGSLLITPISV